MMQKAANQFNEQTETKDEAPVDNLNEKFLKLRET